MLAPTIMDVDNMPLNSDPSSALACAHPLDGGATAQNDALCASEQPRAPDALFNLGIALLHAMGDHANPVSPLLLQPLTDVLDFDLLDGLSRARRGRLAVPRVRPRGQPRASAAGSSSSGWA